MRLFCHGCQADRAVSKYGEGYICGTCLSTIRCVDCGARYTAKCAEGSVFVPATDPPASGDRQDGAS